MQRLARLDAPGVLHHITIRGIERLGISVPGVLHHITIRGIERLGISVPGVGYSVERGEIISRKNDYQLIE